MYLYESRLLQHSRLCNCQRPPQPTSWFLNLHWSWISKYDDEQNTCECKRTHLQRPHMSCTPKTLPTASMECQKIVDETINWTDYVDKRCMEYERVYMGARGAWSASSAGNMKGVLDRLVPGVAAGWRKRQGRRGRERLCEDSCLIFFSYIIILLLLLLFGVSIISTERGLRHERGALVLLDGLVERPQLTQQGHVELTQTDLEHTNTEYLFWPSKIIQRMRRFRAKAHFWHQK